MSRTPTWKTTRAGQFHWSGGQQFQHLLKGSHHTGGGNTGRQLFNELLQKGGHTPRDLTDLRKTSYPKYLPFGQTPAKSPWNGKTGLVGNKVRQLPQNLQGPTLNGGRAVANAARFGVSSLAQALAQLGIELAKEALAGAEKATEEKEELFNPYSYFGEVEHPLAGKTSWDPLTNILSWEGVGYVDPSPEGAPQFPSGVYRLQTTYTTYDLDDLGQTRALEVYADAVDAPKAPYLDRKRYDFSEEISDGYRPTTETKFTTPNEPGYKSKVSESVTPWQEEKPDHKVRWGPETAVSIGIIPPDIPVIEIVRNRGRDPNERKAGRNSAAAGSGMGDILMWLLDNVSEMVEYWEILREEFRIPDSMSNSEALQYMVDNWASADFSEIARKFATNLIVDKLLGPYLGAMGVHIRKQTGLSHIQLGS